MNRKEMDKLFETEEVKEIIAKAIAQKGPVNFFKELFSEEEMTDELKIFIEKIETPNL